MAFDDGNGKGRIDIVVLIRARLVFDEVFALIHFADVVIIRADAGDKRICTDFAARAFGKLRDHERMRIGAARAEHEPAHRRIVEIA